MCMILQSLESLGFETKFKDELGKPGGKVEVVFQHYNKEWEKRSLKLFNSTYSDVAEHIQKFAV